LAEDVAEKIRISSEEIVQRIVDKNHRWQDQSKQNKVSSRGEAFLIVGSHSKFPKEGGPSDLLVDKKNAQKRRTDLRHQI
jgi:uncharacterized protein YbaP (TraB family)